MAIASWDEMNALHRLSLAALQDLAIVEAVDLALDEVMTTLSPAHVVLYDLVDGGLTLQGVRPRDLTLPGKKEVGKSLCDLAANSRQPVYSMDIHCDERCPLQECQEGDIRSLAALPLTANHELLGVLGLASTAERDFAREGTFLTALATTIALALSKARRCHQLRERALELEGRIADCAAELMIRTNELERLNRIFVDREFRIKELRERVKRLEGG